jgi:hypothetical protein
MFPIAKAFYYSFAKHLCIIRQRCAHPGPPVRMGGAVPWGGEFGSRAGCTCPHVRVTCRTGHFALGRMPVAPSF